MGDDLGKRDVEEERGQMEDGNSGPVRVWQAGTEAHQDTDKCGMESERPDGRWEVQGGQVFGNVGKHTRSPRVEKALPADGHKRSRQADEGGRTGQGGEGGILNGGSKEQGGTNAGTRDTDGGKGTEEQKKSTGATRRGKGRKDGERERDQEERPKSKRRRLGGGRREQNGARGRKRIVTSSENEDQESGQHVEHEEPSRKRIRSEYVLERKGEG